MLSAETPTNSQIISSQRPTMVSFKFSTSLLLAFAQGSQAHTLQFSPRDIQRHLFQQQVGNVNSFLYPRFSSHNRQTEEQECPETPFLWKIIDDESGNHVGFGLGTLHLPPELVLSDDAYASIIHVIEDSCNIYGELNLRDPDVQAEFVECRAPVIANSATVSDIPDEAVKAAYEAKILEIVSSIDGIVVDDVYQGLLTLPIFDIQLIIQYANTPEYEPYFLHYIAGHLIPSLDSMVLELGRVAGSLEEVATQCNVLEMLYEPKEDLNVEYLEKALNGSLSDQINTYRCGVVDVMHSVLDVEESLGNDALLQQQLLDDRNEQIAAAIADILKVSNNKSLFAVGFLHWMYGDKSLNNLLKDYGYSLELIPNWGPDDAEDLSNEQCQVEFNSESGVFESTATASDKDSTITPSSDTDTGNASSLFAPTITTVMCIFGYFYFTN